MLSKFSKASNLFFFIAVLAITGCVHHAQLNSVQASTIELNSASDNNIDSTFVKTIAPYKSVVDKEMNVVLIQSERAMDKDQPEGVLGDLIADITLEEANIKYAKTDNLKVQICVLNNGGLRVPLPKGEITKGKIFELMPFENELVVVTLSGEKTKALFDFIANKNGMPVSGIKMGIKNNMATNVLVNGEKFDPTKNYIIVTSDYLSSGGDNMNFFKEAVKTEPLSYKLRDAIIHSLEAKNKSGKTLNAQLDERIYHDK